MARPKRVTRLTIWMNGIPVGYWDATPGTNKFAYFDEWLNDDDGRPLSLSMPFKPGNEPHSGAIVQNYFDNLLPDSEAIRRRIAQHFKTSGMEPYQLLAAVGRDCVGALQVLPADEEPSDLFSIRKETLNNTQVASLIRNSVRERQWGQGDEIADLRLSIAGAQEKTALLWYENRWCRPSGSTPTTHILKLPLGLVGQMRADLRTSVENEWLCAKILHGFKLPVAKCEIAQFEDQKVLVVERFDRRFSQERDWIVRLPQEDFCQATGTSSLRKYQSDGGPGMTRIMEVLLSSSQANLDRHNFFKTQIVFWLLAATDGHAKNFSIFHLPGRQYRSTPLYDILSAHPIIGKSGGKLAIQNVRMAMAVRGSTNYYQMQQIQRRHWITQGKMVGLGVAEIENMFDEILADIEYVIDSASDEISSGFPHDVAEAIFSGLRAQSKKLQA